MTFKEESKERKEILSVGKGVVLNSVVRKGLTEWLMWQ